MPVYNAERFVAEAVRSVQAQTFPHWELVVALDGATDGSGAVARDLAASDARIRVLALPHRGLPATLNAAVTAARGGYVALLDADDIAVPERLEAQLARLDRSGPEGRSGLDVCGGWAREFGASERLLWFPESPEAVRAELVFRVPLLPSTMMARTETLRAYAYDETALVHNDYELLTRIAPALRLGNLPRVLARYRRHPAQMGVAHGERIRREWSACRRAYLRALYPDAPDDDRDAVTRLAESRAHASLDDLRRAGEWLLRLAAAPEPLLQERMARRWHAACCRSAHLGPACYRLYREVASGLGGSPPDARRLRAQCALRIASGSNVHRWISAARRCLKRTHHASA